MRSNLDRLFYIEGTLTIFTALIAAFVLPGFPSGSHRWLSPIEIRLARKRLEEDALTVKIILRSRVKGKFSLRRSRIGRLIHGIEVRHSPHSQRAGLTYPLREASPVSLSPFHSTCFPPPLTATIVYNQTVILLLCAPPVFATLVAFAITR
jgi:hypothetical protein